MPRKIFISYADENMAYSLKRIGRQARKTGRFDEVCLFTPGQLPEYITRSPLMKHKRGGGYWAWKPVVIWETLQKYDEGDFVVYVDAGCSLRDTREWEEYFSYLADYDTVCFQYRELMPSWEQFGQSSTKVRFWSKKTVLEYFERVLNEPAYGDIYNMIWGGCIFCKGKNNRFIKHWLDIVLEKPELIIDPSPQEYEKDFINGGFHTHDQAVITPLAHLYQKEVLVLDEKAETTMHSAITGTRIRAKNFKHYQILMLKRRIRGFVGDSFLDGLKMKLKKI